MDEDDLFGVFETKQPAEVVVVPHLPEGEEALKKRKPDEVVVEDEEEADEGDGEPPAKRREAGEEGSEELCPAAGEGSVVIHDITPFNPELGRKAHRHQVNEEKCSVKRDCIRSSELPLLFM